jgi:5-methylcytosine-specific restriction endonuclease McrA
MGLKDEYWSGGWNGSQGVFGRYAGRMVPKRRSVGNIAGRPKPAVSQKRAERNGISIRAMMLYGTKKAIFIYDRDKRMCTNCGSKYDLTIHHIDGNGRHNHEKGLPMNNAVENLVILCRRCHGSIHGKEGGRHHKKRR